MSEKKYFRMKSDIVKVVYAFPLQIKVSISSFSSEIKYVSLRPEHIEKHLNYEKISEAEFLEVFHEVQNEITLRYHRQFAKENDFVKNESLKSDGY